MADWEKLIMAFFVLILFVPVLMTLANIVNKQTCDTYVSQIAQKDIELNLARQLYDNKTAELTQCKNEYERLITENITKKDIEDLKAVCNANTIEMNSINQKFEVINTELINQYNSLSNSFNVSIIINITMIFVLVFWIIGDLISLSLFGFDIKKIVLQFTRNKITSIKSWVSTKVTKITVKNETKDKKGEEQKN